MKKALIGLIVALGIAAALVPATAQAVAPCPTMYCEPMRVSSNPSYMGWGRVEANTCLAGEACGIAPVRSAVAYRWTGSAWQRTERRSGTAVYIYPYGSGWSWTWTQHTGWLAMRQSALVYSVR